ITDSTIADNEAPYVGGGGIFLRSSDALIARCLFRNNGTDADYSDGGGGIYCLGSSPEIAECTFVENYTIGSTGAAVYCNEDSDAVIRDSTFVNNYDTAVACRAASEATILRSSFVGNRGGAIAVFGSAPLIDGCEIVNNFGVGIYAATHAGPRITNSAIVGNHGGVASDMSSPTIIHSTILDNYEEAGIYATTAGTVTVRDSVVWGNRWGWDYVTYPDNMAIGAGVSASVTYSDIEGGFAGTGNVDANPRINVSPGQWDDRGTADQRDDRRIAGGYRLAPGSPCINAATDAGIRVDLYGTARPQLGTFDMGAHEYAGEGAGTVTGVKFYDINGDGIQQPGEPGLKGWTVFADLDGDGQWDEGEPHGASGPGGDYLISNLPPGDYTLVEVAPSAWRQTYPGISAGSMDLVSDAPGDAQANNYSQTAATSADGRYVVFQSLASNLVPGDTNGVSDIFLADRWTGAIECISRNLAGLPGNAQSTAPAITPDGRYVVFASEASDLIGEPTGGRRHIYLRDRQTGAVEIVSRTSDGQLANGWSDEPVLSADGRYVAFSSTALNLLPGDTNFDNDVFVRDRLLGTTQCVSVGPDGLVRDGNSAEPSLSADGRYVAFTSWSAGLVPGDTNGTGDVFVRDLRAQKTERISVAGNVEGDNYSYDPALSADGRYVAFTSGATNLVPGDTNGAYDVFLVDRQDGSIRRISLGAGGAQANGDSQSPSISADGLRVAFQSYASNLVAGDANHTADVFVYDRSTRATRRVSLNGNGHESNLDSFNPAISADGRHVAFESDASNLTPNDTNWQRDIFLAGPADPAAKPGTYAVTLRSGQRLDGFDFGNRLPGDADTDSDVDIFDVARLQTKYGTASGAAWSDGDFDGNGTVDIFDIALMQCNFGYGVQLPPPSGMPPAESSAADTTTDDSLALAVANVADTAPSTPVARAGRRINAALAPAPRTAVSGDRVQRRVATPNASSHAIRTAARRMAGQVDWAAAVDRVLESPGTNRWDSV
ncbi:MAG: right-handed parallel beta-helix repeat-containing protein, partial [Pirellulales bacterium]